MPAHHNDAPDHTHRGRGAREVHMQAWSAGLKALGWLVVILMAVAIVYAAAMSVVHWSGISV